jgi:putative RNA 2'-phosphotransferase
MNSEDTPSPHEPVELDDERAERLSRFLALVLRHRALSFDLPMDDEGFVPIDDLLDLMSERQPALDWVEPEHLVTLASNQGRQRFEVRGDSVRATYGHSFHRPIHYADAQPPEELYVAVPRARLAEVRAKGLFPVGRQYVHLSVDRAEAEEIGRHHDEHPSVVTIRAREAHTGGVPFHRPTDGIFLVSHLGPEFMNLEVEYGRNPRKSRRR